MEESTIRVLVVDDYEPWRRFEASRLAAFPEPLVIGEASDGPEAVHKAQELQPDLILLDIGLPTWNGIETARRIRNLSPTSKILFVSQESSPEVIEEALLVGEGYVTKTDAGRDLLNAVRTVLSGRKFSGGHVVITDSGKDPDGREIESIRDLQVSISAKHDEQIGRHGLTLYADDERYLDCVAKFIGASLNSRNAAIAVATKDHCESLHARLQSKGVNVEAAIKEGRFIALDATETLSAFMSYGLPDATLFLRIFGDYIRSAEKAARGENPRVAAWGEIGPVLWSQGNSSAAIRVEELANQLVREYDLDLMCGYSQRTFTDPSDCDIRERICARHSALYVL